MLNLGGGPSVLKATEEVTAITLRRGMDLQHAHKAQQRAALYLRGSSIHRATQEMILVTPQLLPWCRGMELCSVDHQDHPLVLAPWQSLRV